jgi:ParB family chromosome partitioning protein
MNRKGGLGRGLEALFADNTSSDENLAVELNINEVEPNRDQPRRDFDVEALSQLAESIRQYGLLQPIIVRPNPNGTYQIIAGERRWRASKMVGESTIVAIIKNLSDEEVMQYALIENLQREDLNAIELALGYKDLIDNCGLTQDQVAAKMAKSRSAVTNTLRLLNLPEEVLNLVKTGKISSGHARALLSIQDKAKIISLAELIVAKDLSVRETEKLSKTGLFIARSIIRKSNYHTEIELALKEELNRKVKIIGKKGGKGKLEIEFYSDEDLAEIAKLLG